MYLYPKWLRAWHILNAILFIILIVTGISMQYTDMANPTYIVSFANAVKWHNFAAFILTGSYVFFVLGNMFTRNGRYYRMKRENFFSDLTKQIKYYAFGIFRGDKHPFPVTEESKFNPLQKLSYVLAMYAGMPLLILSGFVLLFPELAPNKVLGLSGYAINDVIHISMGFFLSVFMVIHIYTCTLGAKPTSLFYGMISGYHRSE
jgi:thiosulfate reductase cytochrome b subunit